MGRNYNLIELEHYYRSVVENSRRHSKHGHFGQLGIDVSNELVDSRRHSGEYGRFGANHFNQLGHVTMSDGAKLVHGLHASENVLF